MKHIWQFDRFKKEWSNPSISDAASIKDLYAVHDHDGNKTQVVEKELFGKLDAQISQYYDRICSGIDLRQKELRGNIALLVASQIYRTPSLIDENGLTTGALTLLHAIEMFKHDDKIDMSKVDVVMNRHKPLELLFRPPDGVFYKSSSILESCFSWNTLKTKNVEEPVFFLSDNPVIQTNRGKVPSTGLGVKGHCLFLPLSPNRILQGVNDFHEIGYKPVVIDENILPYQEMIIRSADRFIYSITKMKIIEELCEKVSYRRPFKGNLPTDRVKIKRNWKPKQKI